MAPDQAVSARAFKREDEPPVLAVLQAGFGRWPSEIRSTEPSEFFHWKHIRGSFGRSVLFVVELDGEVAGFAAYMPWRFRARGHVLTGMRGVDFAVHPDYRRRGVSLAILAAAKSLTGADFIWSNPNEPAGGGALKSGRRPIGRIPHFARLGGRLLQTTRRARARGVLTPESLPTRAPPAREVLADREYMSHLLASIDDPPGRLVTARDVDYLRWRYGQFDEYRGVRATARVRGRGIAIFRARRYGSFWVLDICELLVEGGKRRIARDLLSQVKDAAASDFLGCNFCSRRQAAVHGFIGASRGTDLMVYPLRGDLVLDPTRRDSWAASRGDLELL
jgi:GNAT superfamily N-acetyltransferase